MLRATGCKGGRTGERTPLLIQEGDGAFLPWGDHKAPIPNPQPLTPNP